MNEFNLVSLTLTGLSAVLSLFVLAAILSRPEPTVNVTTHAGDPELEERVEDAVNGLEDTLRFLREDAERAACDESRVAYRRAIGYIEHDLNVLLGEDE